MSFYVIIVLVDFVICYHLLESEYYAFIVLLLFFRERFSLYAPQPGRNAITIGHIDEIDKLFFVVLNIIVKKFDEKGVNRQNISANSYFRVNLIILFKLTLLL